MVDGVCVQNHQLKGLGEFKYPLDLTLDLRCINMSHFECVSLLFLQTVGVGLTLAHSPKLERVLDRSMMGLLFRTDLLAKDRSAVTRVIEILRMLRQKYTDQLKSTASVTTGVNL